MSYPPPPGGDKTAANKLLQPHPSLPARPPPSAQTPAYPPGHGSGRGYGVNNAGYGGYASRAVVSGAPVMNPQASFNGGGYQPSSYPAATSFYQQQSTYTTATPPQIVNPYPLPSQTSGTGRNSGYDPEEEARIAEWSSAYAPKDTKAGQGGVGNANVTPLGTRSNVATPGDAKTAPENETGAAAGGKEKTVVRQGGGKVWEDPSLLEWNPLHPRLFVGNLAGEVTDESLLKAFSKYPSVSKARVIRDKRTTKSKSYGFVSFAETDDFFRAAKEMEGKYIGSHPVRIKRATAEVTATSKRDDKHGKHGKNSKKGGGGGSGHFGGNGVQKSQKGQKSLGPKLLG